MQKLNIKNSRNLNLAADFYSADSDKIIIMCHGFGYDRHEKENKFDKIAASFNKAGYNVLTFDFSGTGESDDDTLCVSKQADDLKSVMAFVRNKNFQNIILFGVSLGSLAAWNAYDEDIKAIIGVGPVTDDGGPNWRSNKFSKEQLEEFDKTGQLVFYKPSGPRDFIVLDKLYYLEKEAVDQKLLLSKIKCPVLIIHADGDSFIPLDASKRAVKIIGDKAEFFVLLGAKHDFLDHIDIVIDKTLSWLNNKNL